MCSSDLPPRCQCPPGHGTGRFGPLRGTWHDEQKLVIRNAQGKEITLEYLGMHFEYELGEVPELRTSIPEDAWN